MEDMLHWSVFMVDGSGADLAGALPQISSFRCSKSYCFPILFLPPWKWRKEWLESISSEICTMGKFS
jgi:hypothetical protein